MDTVATLESTVPSVTLYVKLSEPLKLSFGLYVARLSVKLTVPLDGWVTII